MKCLLNVTFKSFMSWVDGFSATPLVALWNLDSLSILAKIKNTFSLKQINEIQDKRIFRNTQIVYIENEYLN